jgi:bifunctional non-homologous end joining protein LigD
VHEIKFDGYRRWRASIVAGSRPAAGSIDDSSSVKKAPRRSPSSPLPRRRVRWANGHAGLRGLQADLSEGRSVLQYYPFDLPHPDGADLRGASLLDRASALAECSPGHDGGPLKYSEHFVERGEVVLRHASISRRHRLQAQKAPYRSGRPELAQVKCASTATSSSSSVTCPPPQRRVVLSVLGYYDQVSSSCGPGGVGLSIRWPRLAPAGSDPPGGPRVDAPPPA